MAASNNQRFKKGDRVRWTGAYEMCVGSPEAVGTLGTVLDDTISIITDVKWDISDEEREKIQLGTGIYNGNLELVTFEPGDRVRGRDDSALTHIRGKVGTVIGRKSNVGTPANPGRIFVTWDDGSVYTHPRIEYLEPAPAEVVVIDTTKPLEFVYPQPMDKHHDAQLITETSEGHILVSCQHSDINGWYIFDKNGAFVRSEDSSGSALVLRNKPTRVVLYQLVASQPKGYILAGAYGSKEEARRSSVDKQIVRVTSEDGKVISVDLL